MRHLLIALFIAIFVPFLCSAQQLPQFTNTDFDGWTYNNPRIPLTADNIGGSKIALYVSQSGLVLMLQSAPFCCQGIDSISAQVNWYTPSFRDPDFVLSRTALTLAVDDAMGNPIDSVTAIPTKPGTSSHMLNMTIAVPHGVDSLSMRLVSWQANVTSCGIIRRALFEAVTSSAQQLIGDLDGDETLSVGDVTMLIKWILYGYSDGDIDKGDMDGSGNLDVADVTLLIHAILTA